APGRQPGGVAALQPGLALRPSGGGGPARSTAGLVARGLAGNAGFRRCRELGADPDQPDAGSLRGDGHGRPGLGPGLGQPRFTHLAGSAAGDARLTLATPGPVAGMALELAYRW